MFVVFSGGGRGGDGGGLDGGRSGGRRGTAATLPPPPPPAGPSRSGRSRFARRFVREPPTPRTTAGTGLPAPASPPPARGTGGRAGAAVRCCRMTFFPFPPPRRAARAAGLAAAALLPALAAGCGAEPLAATEDPAPPPPGPAAPAAAPAPAADPEPAAPAVAAPAERESWDFFGPPQPEETVPDAAAPDVALLGFFRAGGVWRASLSVAGAVHVLTPGQAAAGVTLVEIDPGGSGEDAHAAQPAGVTYSWNGVPRRLAVEAPTGGPAGSFAASPARPNGRAARPRGSSGGFGPPASSIPPPAFAINPLAPPPPPPALPTLADYTGGSDDDDGDRPARRRAR